MSWNQRFYGKNPFGGAFGARGGRQPQGEPEGSRRPGRKFPAKAGIGIAAVILLALVGMNAYYVLDEDNYAVVTTLGKPRRCPRRDCILRSLSSRTYRRYRR